MLVGNPRSVVMLVVMNKLRTVTDEVIPVYEVIIGGAVSLVTVVGNP